MDRAIRPGRMHDQTALKTEGISDLFEQFSQVKANVDAGHRGLAKQQRVGGVVPPLEHDDQPWPGSDLADQWRLGPTGPRVTPRSPWLQARAAECSNCPRQKAVPEAVLCADR